jgi:hypothetical protein
MSQETFEIQLQTTHNEFHSSVGTNFIRTLQFFRDTTHGNQVISIYTTNWIFTPGPTIWTPFNTKSLSHGSNCSCATWSTCVESATIYSLNIILYSIFQILFLVVYQLNLFFVPHLNVSIIKHVLIHLLYIWIIPLLTIPILLLLVRLLKVTSLQT